MNENKKWYAVQECPEDAWDYGSYDYAEAVEMAHEIVKEKGEALIAEIDEAYGNYCDDQVWFYPEDFDDLREPDTKYTEVYPL